MTGGSHVQNDADGSPPTRQRRRSPRPRPTLRPDGTMRTGPAAAVLGVSTKTLGRMIDDGELKGGRVPGDGTHRWVDPADLVRKALAANRRAFVPVELHPYLKAGDPEQASEGA